MHFVGVNKKNYHNCVDSNMLYVHNFSRKLDAIMEYAERHSSLVNKSQVKFAV